MFLLKKEIGMPEEQLDEVWEVVTPLVTSYTNTLIENPGDLYWLEMNYRALLNGAHKTSERVLEQKFDYEKLTVDERVRATYFNWTGTRIEIQMLANEEIKIGGGACGSGSCSIDGSKSIDEKGPLSFSCPSCGETNTRPYGGYVYRCKNKKCPDPEAVLPKSLRKIQH